ncbi:cyclodeaminase/cyclohydrolase family protein [Pseudoflavonifractor phocaeensis]|uniref:cyclodeaminase/cyclohydrolase family protein n=1 Tax=Pseudoflavonifractor phocaeensis TaxID=1870988 RepID=UPI00195B718C|nr:cyclodeaminase/cyclohydrolase family protein [Pseudoflavonifractor phocaeensis]MBM6924728.1 cyclodeaminase/cyclohydrolase family protein [Pseudoflavonifractor phocaeensis]
MHTAEQTCGAFLDALASKAPTPGGGGASALAGAVGTALCTMVGNFTVGKKKYAAVEEDVKALMAQAEQVREELLAQVDADAAAFEPLSQAYAIPKDDPGRGEVMERCLRAAAAPPMTILRLCCKAIDLHGKMLEKGSVIMLSDVGTGAALCRGALLGAALNVKVNTKSMADRAYAQAMDQEAEALVAQYTKLADQVYEAVMGRFC